MQMDQGLDTGAMVKVVRCAITAETTASSLHDELAKIGAAAMVETLRHPITSSPQPANGATYARKIDKAEAKIDFTRSSIDVRNHIHGLSPFPGAWMSVNGARIKVLKASLAKGRGEPGTFITDTLAIACVDGAVQLLALQREGKSVMGAETFLRGFPIPAGSRAA
jgi:methionyl-tRNA formyltransferase